jgi:putative PEP-CTERM system histidine kinase
LRDDEGSFNNTDAWQSRQLSESIDEDDSLIKFIESNGYVINLMEIESRPNEYERLSLPGWLSQVNHPWLIVPLHGTGSLLGFVVLANPLVVRAINWEDRDLLKTAAKQVASYLMVLMTSAQLAESKQFEVFTRLSAYMVHDLKNIAAELDLVAMNARKHAANPEFVADAFETVENAAGDINRLLEQLRNKQVQGEKKVQLDLTEVISEVVAAKQHILPSPQFQAGPDQCLATLEKGRLSNVLAHLIENAQQATPDDGEVTIILSTSGAMHAIEIKDSGHGMDKDFIQNRLFKAFDTTKGNAGMGIGMFESREYIRQMGGDISVHSKPGKGSIITLSIPSDKSPDQG